MRPGGGRDKGNGFERKVAKILTDAWGVKFVRTPNSGAFHRLAPSDIIPEDKKHWDSFKFHLECKCREGWNLSQLLTSSNCAITQWYDEEEKKQVESRGDKFYEKQLLLIFSKNRDNTYVMYKELQVPHIHCTNFLSSIVFDNYFSYRRLVKGSHYEYFTITTLSDFLAKVDSKVAFTEINNA